MKPWGLVANLLSLFDRMLKELQLEETVKITLGTKAQNHQNRGKITRD